MRSGAHYGFPGQAHMWGRHGVARQRSSTGYSRRTWPVRLNLWDLQAWGNWVGPSTGGTATEWPTGISGGGWSFTQSGGARGPERDAGGTATGGTATPGWDGNGWDWDANGWDGTCNRWDGNGWDGNGWDGNGWDGNGWDGNGWDGNGWDGNGWDGNGWDGNGWDGNGWDGNGWDGNGWDGNGWDGNGWESQSGRKYACSGRSAGFPMG